MLTLTLAAVQKKTSIGMITLKEMKMPLVGSQGRTCQIAMQGMMMIEANASRYRVYFGMQLVAVSVLFVDMVLQDSSN
jgi:hypothetical protein